MGKRLFARQGLGYVMQADEIVGELAATRMTLVRRDGRELVPNGVDEVPAGESVDFIVNAGQSIRVVEEMLPEGAAAVPAEESAIAKVTA